MSTSGTTAPARKPVAPAPMTACRLIGRADVEQAIGRPVGPGREGMQENGSTCDFEVAGGLISIAIQELAAKPDLRAEADAMRREIPGAATRKPDGFEDALFLDIPEAGTQLHVIEGERKHVMIAILGLGDAQQVAPFAERLARRAVDRLSASSRWRP